MATDTRSVDRPYHRFPIELVPSADLDMFLTPPSRHTGVNLEPDGWWRHDLDDVSPFPTARDAAHDRHRLARIVDGRNR